MCGLAISGKFAEYPPSLYNNLILKGITSFLGYPLYLEVAIALLYKSSEAAEVCACNKLPNRLNSGCKFNSSFCFNP